jgi:hyperosmotically inducible protein
MKTKAAYLVVATLTSALVVLTAGCSKPSEATGAPAPSTSVGTEIDDSVITTSVKTALLSDPNIKSFDLKVETRKGVVQLSGFVENQAQVERAMVIARQVPGVTDIESKVDLKGKPTTVGNKIDDSVVTTQVRTALLADPSVKSFDIAVVTRKGEVQLSGFVDNPGQIERAIGIARVIEGVQQVNNEMSVKK